MAESAFEVQDQQDWQRVAAEIAHEFVAGYWYALHGPMGAGKTSFTQALVAKLSGDGNAVTSPTFDLCHRYPGTPDILHFDLYRFDAARFDSQAQALESIDWHLVEAADAIALVEWPENLPSAVAAPAGVLRFSYAGTGRRMVMQTY